MKSRIILACLFVALLAAIGGVLLIRAGSEGGPGAILAGNDGGVSHEYVIAAGTFGALSRGENVSVLPDELHLHVGDTIRIRNDDDQGGTVGPFSVDAHSVMTQKFTSPGTYSGLCTVHPSGKISITVDG